MQYVITNISSGRLVLPPPIGGALTVGQSIIANAPASLMERLDPNVRSSNKFQRMIDAKLLTITARTDPAESTALQTVTSIVAQTVASGLQVLDNLTAQIDGIATVFTATNPYDATLPTKVWLGSGLQNGTVVPNTATPYLVFTSGPLGTITFATAPQVTDGPLLFEYFKVAA